MFWRRKSARFDNKLPKRPDSDFTFAHPEGTREKHAVRWLLAIGGGADKTRIGGSHQELAGWDEPEVHPQTVGKSLARRRC